MPKIRKHQEITRRDPWPSPDARARQDIHVVPLQPIRPAWVVDGDGVVHEAEAVAVASAFLALDWPAGIRQVDEHLGAGYGDYTHRRSYTASPFAESDFTASSPFEADIEVYVLVLSPDPEEGVTGWWPSELVFFTDKLAYKEGDRIQWEAEEAERVEREAEASVVAEKRRKEDDWKETRAMAEARFDEG